jgi:chromosome segregation ATPase
MSAYTNLPPGQTPTDLFAPDGILETDSKTESLAAAFNDTRDSLAQGQSALLKLKAELSALQARHEGDRRLFQRSLDERRTLEDRLRMEIATQQQNERRLADEIKALEAQADRLRTEISFGHTQLEGLRGTAKEKLAEYAGRDERLQSLLVSQSQREKERTTRVAVLEIALQRAEEEARVHKSFRTQALAKEQASQLKITCLEARLEELASQLASSQDVVANAERVAQEGLTKSRSAAQKVMATLQRELTESRARATLLETQLRKLQSILN